MGTSTEREKTANERGRGKEESAMEVRVARDEREAKLEKGRKEKDRGESAKGGTSGEARER